MTDEEKRDLLDEMVEIIGEDDGPSEYESRQDALGWAITASHEGQPYTEVLTVARAFHAFLTGKEPVASVTPIRAA